MALYMYELRAWRRKQEKVNRKAPEHDDTGHGRLWRHFPHDAPLDEHEIELRPTGSDGHILINV